MDRKMAYTRNVDCWYFKNAICREGSNCRYRHVQGPTSEATPTESGSSQVSSTSSSPHCRFFMQGTCRFGNRCRYIHRTNAPERVPSSSFDSTENCASGTTEPHSYAQAVDPSSGRDKSCGVCLETILVDKSTPEQRFGILPNCNHCFCLTCMQKWHEQQIDYEITCPECRVPSDFFCPSTYWVDSKEEKDKFITDYKDALSTQECKRFIKSLRICPIGNKCLYRHLLFDGTQIYDVAPPIAANVPDSPQLTLFGIPLVPADDEA